MFTKLIQAYPEKTTHQEKQVLVRQVLNQIKQADVKLVLDQLHQEYEKTIPILKNHPHSTVQLIFQKLTVEDCIRLMNLSQNQDLQTKQNALLRLLYDIGKNVDNKKDQQFIEWFSKMYTKYSSLQKILIFMRQLVENYLQKFNDEFLPQLLADFINGSRLVIQTYLKLRSQAPKFDYDYMEHGQQILKYTETWLKTLYISMLKKINVPESKELKLALLNGICDIVGAVMQVQREGNIEYDICNQILAQCYNYTKKLTTLNEFNQIYLNRLRSSNFSIPHHKIIIPTSYPSNTITFPKQSYGYIVFQFLKQSLELYSDQLVFNYLIPVVNELAQFEYQIKSQIENLFVQKLVSHQVSIKTCFEGHIPLSILYFNIWHFQQKRNKVILQALDKIYEKIRIENPANFVNNLKLLTNFHVEDLDNEINQFIGLRALQVSKQHPQLLISLIKNIRWNNANEKGQQVWREVINEMSKKGQVKSQVERLLKNRKNSNGFQKQVLKMVSN